MDDSQLLAQFQACTLPFDQWTHRAHVKIAFIHLSLYPFAEAARLVSAGIQKYNAHNNVPKGPTSGYNETTTIAMLHLIAATMRAYAKTYPTPDADSFCDMHPQLMNKHVLRLFYSPQRRMHPDAKTRFVEPDLATLPHILDLDSVSSQEDD